MFGKRGAAKMQAERDEEWRLLVRAIPDPDRVASEADEARFRAHLRELGAGGHLQAQRDQRLRRRLSDDRLAG
jgi:hypothetical protein